MTEDFISKMQVRWADLDPNFHLRHSVYYDWGALCRMEYLGAAGITIDVMQGLKIGPILFREECTFRREIRMGDEVTIGLKLLRSRRDFSRWSFQHQVVKNGDTVAAMLQVDGAWMDVVQRKLVTPPPQIASIFEKMEKTNDFEWI
ncbi:MAG: thioesterase [Flaviaesturariibacter sp.]|nr:thioesterase [Flaviaesturariibacter sp.]